jgi:oxygen-dependent protoporphyrinogen oxidase
MRIAIVGAGISGLTTAFYLARARPDWELAVYDAGPRPGGTMQTVDVEGFRFEAGGNGFLTNKPDTLKLIEDSGAQGLVMPSSDLARKRFIYDGRSVHRLPESPPAFLQTRLLSWPQKLRVLAEPLVPPRRDGAEETLQQFGYRRVGRGLTDVFLDAMTAGIYGTTPDRVSVNAAFPLVVSLEREHGGLFRGMLARRKKQAGPGGVLTSFAGGVASFIDHLQQVTRAEWRMSDPVVAVARDGNGWRVESGRGSARYDQVVIASQAHAAAAMLAGSEPQVAAELRAVEYTPIAVVGLGYRALAQSLDGFGLLTTSGARAPVLGILWDSSIFPDRAPPGCKSLRVMIGGQRSPELVAQEPSGLLATAREGVERIMGIAQAPDVTFVQRWDRGIPHYTVGHLARVARIEALAAARPGLHLVSNAYNGIAMNDCTRNGRELAGRIAGGST